jgi:heme-degrading monooxygenase HmoA
MIARTWRGKAMAAKADAYPRHFMAKVVPNLGSIAGHRGAYLLRREADGLVEFLVVTLWDSIETVKGFAGPNPDVSHVEPEGQAALLEFDDYASHYEVAYSSLANG